MILLSISITLDDKQFDTLDRRFIYLTTTAGRLSK